MVTIVAGLLSAFVSPVVQAQIAPGPYEILAFEDGFIIEAFCDLQRTSGSIADWSGHSSSSWVSPNAYDNHEGTDIALQTGTPLYAAVAGVISEVVTNVPKNNHDSGTPYGNFVRIAVDAPSPKGESLDLIYMHMWTVAVTNGQRVAVGDQVGLSDNTGNSTSEHLHTQSEIRGVSSACPFYWGHYKYPIMLSPSGTFQIGRVVKIKAASTAIRADRFDFSPSLGTVYQDQLYFASYPKRGYYRIFIPNNSSNRSGWVRATDVEEVFTGTVIQTIPDQITYQHATPLQTNYVIRSTPNDAAGQIGTLYFGGGRFVADQITNGYYRIAIPGATATSGWVKADSRMIVYPNLINPALDVASLPDHEFPITESFSVPGKSMFGRPKFNRMNVKAFTPPSPGGDGNALFVTDATNSGNGLAESILVGKPGHANCFVECDVYFNYLPSYVVPSASRWERYGILLRDDGFGGVTHTFEGGGNCYAILWDNDDGQLRAGRIDNAGTTAMQSIRLETTNGWRRLRIEARTNEIRFFLNGTLLTQLTDSTTNKFHSGQAGVGYRWYPGSPASYPAERGAYFDNFTADTLDSVPLLFKEYELQEDGRMRFQLSGTIGSTNAVERSLSLGANDWTLVTNVVNRLSVMEFLDSETNGSSRFYRARRLP